MGAEDMEARRAEARAAMQKIEQITLSTDVPIKLQGRVVDQSGNSVPGATIVAEITSIANGARTLSSHLASAARNLVLHVDQQGRFEIKGTGSSVHIPLIIKSRYESYENNTETRNFEFWPTRKAFEANHPVLFHLKKSEGNGLIRNFYNIETKDGNCKFGLDLLGEKIIYPYADGTYADAIIEIRYGKYDSIGKILLHCLNK